MRFEIFSDELASLSASPVGNQLTEIHKRRQLGSLVVSVISDIWYSELRPRGYHFIAELLLDVANGGGLRIINKLINKQTCS